MRLGLIILLLMLTFLVTAQTGGRKNERSIRGRGVGSSGRVASKGHADEFAKGNRNSGYFWRHLLGIQRSSWENRVSGTNSRNFKLNKTLFSFTRPQGHHDNDELLNENRKKRNRWIQMHRGNARFTEKKYN